MRRCIIIDVEMLENRKLERLFEKLTKKYGNAVAIYDEYDEIKLVAHALGLTPYTDRAEISAKIKTKYLNNSDWVLK